MVKKKKKPVKAAESDSEESSSGDEGEQPTAPEAAPAAEAPPAPDLNSDSDDATSAPRRPPIIVEYCPACSFPAEYCEYSGMLEKCKPWLAEYYKRKAAEKAEGADGAQAVAAQVDGLTLDEMEDKVKKKKKPVLPEGAEKVLPGGKVKKKEETVVLISVSQRQKRKSTTIVTGLELFGVKLADAATVFKKTFSCGASVVKTPSLKEQIEIQGEFRDQLIETVLPKKFPQVPREAVFLVDESGKNRTPAYD
eukprot:RCo003905